MQARGVARRESMRAAAIELLNTVPIEELSFKAIAEHAGVPEGSAYHFYANKYDLFTEAAKQLSERFVEAQQGEIDATRISKWSDLADLFVERGAEVYTSTPAARQLLIGGRTPPEIKMQDRINDRAVAEIMRARFQEFFVLPESCDAPEIFFYFIEITDLMFSLSVIEYGKITPGMLEEAKRAGIGYLSMYLPPMLEKR